jgi:hypothetical protein
VCPYPLDELVGRHQAVGIDHKGRQDALLAGMTQDQDLTVGPGLDGTEQAELHRHRNHPGSNCGLPK